ncbi:MAG: hemerythrin domain-containing protein [Kofleriaceae bacterium]|nr:hemerythrin domain-containing protein [Myxococcales bacterium]MCB9564427.1 hemerythrin domain-containing protein [Kofleriaceae bacterium]MCB9573068.1 hemerythrin domain-containing protein [Kofleriaceae bacterium]
MSPLLITLQDLARRAPSTARNVLRRLGLAADTRQTASPTSRPTAPSTPAEGGPSIAPGPTAPDPAASWELRSQADLVAHIEGHYHAGLRRDLPGLLDAARRVEREHAQHPAVPAGLTDLLVAFADDVESHMAKEERMLFPALRTGARGGPLDMPMRMMEREHHSHAVQLDRIHGMTDDLTAPANADPAWTALYAAIATMEAELRQHVYLEDHVLFARATGER